VAALALAFLVAIPAAAAAQEMLAYDGTTSYPVGGNAKGFSAGDCDGDGTIDLIAAGQQSNDAVTLRNDGTGRFEFGRSTAVESQPTGAACGDFNGDGLIDIATVSRDKGLLTIYKRKETGGFTVHGTRPAGLQPSSLIAGHLNGDGHIDLVAVGSRSRDVTVYLGTGSNTLPPFSSIRVPMDRPHAAAIADFNQDGHPDIAVSGASNPFVVLLMGDGATFTPLPDRVPSPFAHTRRPPKSRGIAAGDLNQDGKPDLAVLSTNSAISLYLNDGAGNFTLLDAFGVPPGAESIVLEDLDGDGLTDLAVLYSSTNSVQVLRASVPGRFPLPVSAPSTDTYNAPGATASRTVLLEPPDPESAHTQLVTASATARAILLVDQDEITELSVTPLRSLAEPPQTLLLADMNRDGIPDAVVTRKVRGSAFPIQILPGDTNGGYALPVIGGSATCGDGVVEGAELCDDANTKSRDGCAKNCVPEVKAPLISLEAADLDCDGSTDLVGVDGRGQLFILFGDGSGRYREVRLLAKAHRKTPAAVADFTGDGEPDILYIPAKKRDGALVLLANQRLPDDLAPGKTCRGLGQFSTIPIPSGKQFTGPLLAGDIDSDGNVDAVLGHRKGWTVMYNDGAGPMREGSNVAAPRGLLSFAAADFDEDGWLDILATFNRRAKSGPVLLYTGAGTGTFVPTSPAGIASPLAYPYVIDIDEDLHQDIVSCDPLGPPGCRVYYGNGQGEFGASALPDDTSVGRDVRGAGVGDFDGDGELDLVGISRRDNRGMILFRHPDRTRRQRAGIGTGKRPAALGVVDLDGNSLPDIVVVNEATNDLSIFMSHGQRAYTTPAPVRLPAGGLGAPALAVGDINGDGRPDLAVTQAGSNTVTPFLNLGGVVAALGSMTTGAGPRGVALGDLNGDATLDIVTANRGADTISVFLSGVDGTYTRQDFSSWGMRPSSVAIADLDGDGLGDVIVTNEKIVSNLRLGNLVTLPNDGAGGFNTTPAVHLRGRMTPRAVCSGDFDGDGIPDVAVASIDSNDVMVLHGDGNGGWRRDEIDFPVGQQASAVWCYDADGDGRTDIAFGRRKGGDVGAILTGGITP
jgi:cysteine-rich repeat protein